MSRISAGEACYVKLGDDGAPGWEARIVKSVKPRTYLVYGPGDTLSTLVLTFATTINPAQGVNYTLIPAERW
eukprot:1561274-Alexandrium_andersonii.AAC.1